MSETTLVLLSCCLMIGFTCWRVLACFQSSFGVDRRSRDRERLDYLRSVEHLVEKNMALHTQSAANIMDVTRQHIIERNSATQTNAEIEKVSTNGHAPKVKDLVDTTDPESVGASYFQ